MRIPERLRSQDRNRQRHWAQNRQRAGEGSDWPPEGEAKISDHRSMRPAQNPVQALASLPADPEEALERQWLQDTLAWLRYSDGMRTRRLHELAAAIIEAPGMRERVACIWSHASLDRLLCDAALPEETSLLREISVRLRRRLMPQLEGELDLYSTLEAAGLTFADAEWVAGLSHEDIASWSGIVGASNRDICRALRLLAARIAAIGLSRDLAPVIPRLWRNERGEHESPFDDLLEAAACYTNHAAALEDVLQRCRMVVGVAHARLEEQGVSSNLVFRLDLLGAQMERMEALLRLHDGRENGRKFAALLVRGFAEDHGTRAMLRNAVNRLARRVVEHTGRAGEHYIAGSRSEWRSMGLGAAGAGLITAFTALFKYVLAAAPFAPLWIGVTQSLNYAASFLVMQSLGWMLASKMPAMTASALANAMSQHDRMHKEVNLIAAITRTQLIVTVGNLLGAIPSALLIDACLRWMTGHPFLSEEAALHGLRSMNPVGSLTILYATITGGFLWLASLAAGWTGNWMALHRLPAAVAQSRTLRRLLGSWLAEQLGARMDRGFSGAVGYVCLGFLLGLLPFVGAFGGVPLEVRHITLASASVAYDISALLHRAGAPVLAMMGALFGVAVTGVLNLSVSFALGLWLAVRARNLDTRGRRTLVRALAREIRHHPARFLWDESAENPAKSSLASRAVSERLR
jgi:site-specific recombinase